MTDTWRPIAELDPIEKAKGIHFILGHDEHGWIRFGRFYQHQGEWYYSGTNERSQYAQAKGDEPTHFMPMPKRPFKPSE